MKTTAKILGAILALFVIVIIAVGSTSKAPSTASGPQPTPAAPSTQTATPPSAPPAPVVDAGPATSVADGTYAVGTDIKAGTWRTDGTTAGVTGYCGWSRSSDASGSLESIVANNLAKGPEIVKANTDEFVTFYGGCTWTVR